MKNTQSKQDKQVLINLALKYLKYNYSDSYIQSIMWSSRNERTRINHIKQAIESAKNILNPQPKTQTMKKAILKKFSNWMQSEILKGNMTIHEAEAMQQDFNSMSAKRLSNLLINFNL